MSHLPTLITDLALILVSAGVVTLLFKWLKQPLVFLVVGEEPHIRSLLGYVPAGVKEAPAVKKQFC